ncbi:MAG: MFS transporter [Dehalococcoidia bacterium]|nr:MFS transporter [Dehalococcoidia bacterium]
MALSDLRPAPKSGLYEGWIVVIAAGFIVFLISSSFLYGFGAIFTNVRDEFGWSAAATSLAFSVRSEVGGVASPLVGYWIDRFGPRRTLFTGIILMVIGVLLITVMQTLLHFYIAMFVIAIGTTAAGGQVGQSAISTWFRRRRARAMSFMTVGAGLGGTMVVVFSFLVDELGWRTALRIIAFIILVVGLGASNFVRSRPRDHHQPMDGIALPAGEIARHDDWGIPPMRAIRTRAFAFFSIAIVLAQLGSAGFIVHQIPYMEITIGLSKTAAGATVMVFTLVSIVGRLGFGYLGDRIDKRYCLAGALALMGVGELMLVFATNAWQAIGAVALIAPGFGGIVPVRPALLADYFGTKHFGQINGWGRLMFTTGGAVGAWLVGRIFDVTDGYTVAWLVASLTVLAGVPIMLLATPPTDLMRQYQDEADVAWEAEQAAARRAAAPPDGEVDGQPAAQS